MFIDSVSTYPTRNSPPFRITTPLATPGLYSGKGAELIKLNHYRRVKSEKFNVPMVRRCVLRSSSAPANSH